MLAASFYFPPPSNGTEGCCRSFPSLRPGEEEEEEEEEGVSGHVLFPVSAVEERAAGQHLGGRPLLQEAEEGASHGDQHLLHRW